MSEHQLRHQDTLRWLGTREERDNAAGSVSSARCSLLRVSQDRSLKEGLEGVGKVVDKKNMSHWQDSRALSMFGYSTIRIF